MKEFQIRAFYNNALRASYSSPDEETKVGCIIVSKDLEILSEGYNGFITDDLDLPTKRPEKYDYIIHAESSAICEAAKKGEALKGAIAVITISPCINCCRKMYRSGIREVYFKDKHSTFDSVVNAKDFKISLTKVGGFYKMIMDI